MANTISIGQLRQNPTAMIRAVRSGATYTLTDRGEPIADIVPHRERRWVPIAEAAEMLTAIGPDPSWADEVQTRRHETRLEDPWESGA